MHRITYKRMLFLPLALMLGVLLVFAGCDQSASGPGTSPVNGRDGSRTSNATATVKAKQSVSVSYNFDDGTDQGWTLDDPAAEVTQAKAYSTSYSLGVDRGGGSAAKELTAHIEPSELAGGVQIDTLSYKYKETNGNSGGGGGGLRLLDSSGNLIIGAASGAPKYNYVGDSGPTGTGDSPNGNWDTWVQVDIAFDWSAGSADVTFTDLEASGQPEDTYAVDLASTSGVARIDVAHYGTHYNGFSKNGPQTSQMHFWVDDISFTREGSGGSGGDLISNLSAQSNAGYQLATLSVDTLQYIDRDYTFLGVPGAYDGAAYIQTANDDKAASGGSFLSFDLARQATVAVLYDHENLSRPSWLSDANGWVDTGVDAEAESYNAPQFYRLYEKTFSAGTVTLSGNDGISSSSMYSVAITEGPGLGEGDSGGGGDPGDGYTGDGTTPGGNPANGNVNNIVPITEAMLVAGATGDPVEVTAIQDNGDGTTTTWTGTVDPGKIQRLHNGSAMSWITVNHIPEGGVTVGNDIEGSHNDVELQNLEVKAPDGTTLYDDGPLTIYPRTHTRPWWYNTPQANPNWDRSLLPKWKDNTPNASLAGDYDSKTGTNSPDGQDRNGPMGYGLLQKQFNNTGPHAGLGPLPSWDTPYVVNPTADNERVMRNMADAFGPVPFHLRDPGTLKMLTIADWPDASAFHFVNKSDNPCVYVNSNNPITQLKASRAHGGGYTILASMVFDNSYYREELAFNANWQVISKNERYRDYENGNLFAHGQTRGKGWSIRTVSAAATLCDNYNEYFKGMLDATRAEALKQHPGDGRLPVDTYDITNGGIHDKHLSNYMNDYLVIGIGFAINMGHSNYQDLMDIFGQWPVQRLLDAPHELATWYHVMGKRPDGSLADDWPETLQLSAANSGTGNIDNNKMANALQEDENSFALINILNNGNAQQYGRIAGDFNGAPTSSDNYAAYLGAATALAKQYNVPRADQAWTEYEQYERVNYGNRMQYNLVPRN